MKNILEEFYDHPVKRLDETDVDGNVYYDGNAIIKECYNMVTSGILHYICDSEDIDEDASHGEFLYYIGIINDIGIIYMASSHPTILPARIHIYGPECTYEIRHDWNEEFTDVNSYRTNSNVYKAFFLNEKEREEFILEFLKNTDRPKLEKYFD